MVHVLDEVGRFSDVELVGRLERLVKSDRALTAKLIVHLGEVEVRGLHHARSYSSMFEYCRSGLGMSEGEAGLRILAARVGRRFPLVLERLGAGDVHLTAIKLLAPHLTAENHTQLLERVRGMTKRKIEVLVAELAPKPDVPARMRKLPQPRTLHEANTAASRTTTSTDSNAAAMSAAACNTTLTLFAPAATISAATSSSDGAQRASQAAPSDEPCSAALTSFAPTLSMPPAAAASGSGAEPPASHAAAGAADASSSTFALQPRRRRARLTPLSPGRYNLDLTVGQEAHDALEQLVELFRHQNPSGDMTGIVERALCELLKREMKRRFGHHDAPAKRDTRQPAPAAEPAIETKPAAEPEPDITSEDRAVEVTTESPADTAKTRSALKSPESRYIPMAVRREVHARDEGQCTFVSDDGRRCTERGFLQLHHHDTTFARGGEATADNLRIMCRAHNMHLAHRDYGQAFMHQKLRQAAARNQLSLVPAQNKL